MRRSCLLLATASLLLNLSSARVAKDLVTSLPDIGFLPSDWYSGFLTVNENKTLHYVFVTSLSDPENDPVMVWLEGGPGCSSMLTLFNGHGPFTFDDGDYQIRKNAYSWNRRVNMLYIEQSAGVGYSWTRSDNDMHTTDLLAAKDLFAALQDWYSKWSEFRKNDLYLAGYSYGGVYVPYQAYEIIQWNN